MNKRFLAYNSGFVGLTIMALMIFRDYKIAMWFGVCLAMLSAISNDSVQTLGTFLISNRDVAWWKLWIFIGGIFLAVLIYGWYSGGGSVDYGRLRSIEEADSFKFFQIMAPVILLILTYYKIPVSTTFLLLSVFSNSKTIEKMLTKTFVGYVVAFLVAILVWYLLTKFCKKYFSRDLDDNEKKMWRVFQWGSTAFLWSSWLAQDIANIAVYMTRKISSFELIVLSLLGFVALGILLYAKGGGIQTIVKEKTDVMEVRAATLIDLMFALILFVFKTLSDFPMSTTWVFLGLLAGREFALLYYGDFSSRNKFKEEGYQRTLLMILKDLKNASIGLVVSILLVVLMNLG